MNERLKEVRTSKGMNQHDFAKSLGIGQSTLAMMEVGKRDITERHVKTICAIHGVDEHWFRTGEGEPFRQTEKDLLDRLSEEYKLSDRERATISSFLKLSDKDRAAVMGYVDALVDKLGSDSASDNTAVPTFSPAYSPKTELPKRPPLAAPIVAYEPDGMPTTLPPPWLAPADLSVDHLRVMIETSPGVVVDPDGLNVYRDMLNARKDKMPTDEGDVVVAEAAYEKSLGIASSEDSSGSNTTDGTGTKKGAKTG